MPRVNFVKKARKSYKNAGIKKGESYYWWKFRYGGKHMSKVPPKASQLTQSEFLGTVYSIQEEMEEAKPESADDLEGMIAGWTDQIDELRDNCQEKFDNMPEGLQQGDTGQLLEERVSAMEDWSSELQNIDCTPDEDMKAEDLETFLSDKMQEIMDINVNT